MDIKTSDVDFECHGAVRRFFKQAMVNPLANYLPTRFLRGLLRFGKSELASANWTDPGGWKSMIISYTGKTRQVADRILLAGGTLHMALRNRRRLAGRVISELIDSCPSKKPHLLSLGAGPGQIIIDAIKQARRPSEATMVDLNPEASDYGRELARREGVEDSIYYIVGDVRDVSDMLSKPPDIVVMLGICEYLTDIQISSIAETVSGVMPPGSSVVFNSISESHGTDRFFRRIFGLHMNYRSPHQLQELISRGGFGDFVSIREPLGVYHVIVGQRSDKNSQQEYLSQNSKSSNASVITG